MVDAGTHTVEQVVVCRIIRPVEGGFEGQGVGRTVTFEHQAAQAQQGRAVVAPMVNPMLEAS
jgi:hypothetical protein